MAKVSSPDRGFVLTSIMARSFPDTHVESIAVVVKMMQRAAKAHKAFATQPNAEWSQGAVQLKERAALARLARAVAYEVSCLGEPARAIKFSWDADHAHLGCHLIQCGRTRSEATLDYEIY